jgi:hypothetical protein
MIQTLWVADFCNVSEVVNVMLNAEPILVNHGKFVLVCSKRKQSNQTVRVRFRLNAIEMTLRDRGFKLNFGFGGEFSRDQVGRKFG